MKPAPAPARTLPFVFSALDLDIGARTVFGEARGEPLDGKIAVAWVLRNRAARGLYEKRLRALFGDGRIASACRARLQFSCWNERDPNRNKIETVTGDDPVFQECQLAVLVALHGYAPDPTAGSTHYHTTAKPAWATAWPPAWAAGKQPVCAIGAHSFYNDIE